MMCQSLENWTKNLRKELKIVSEETKKLIVRFVNIIILNRAVKMVGNHSIPTVGIITVFTLLDSDDMEQLSMFFAGVLVRLPSDKETWRDIIQHFIQDSLVRSKQL